MPANLTPQYYVAEDVYKKANTAEEKIAALQEMLAVIPKHKGTDKLQGDIRKRIAKLKKEQEKVSSSKKGSEDPFTIERQGAGQIFVVGYPNTGKSTLVGTLTSAKTNIQEYPFSTPLPVVGMIPYEDIHIQLIDTPPVTHEGFPGNFSNALRHCNIIIVLVDLSSGDCMEHIQGIIDNLKTRNLLSETKTNKSFTIDELIVLGTKSDLPHALDNLEIIHELVPNCPVIKPVSLVSGEGIEELSQELFGKLNVIRIYTKAPGQKPQLEKPYILPLGANITDLAENIHKDIAQNLKSARVWGSARFDGQNVEHDYVLADKDIVELNS